MSEAGDAGNRKGKEQEYSQPSRRSLTIRGASAPQQERDSYNEQEAHDIAHGKLAEEILKDSEGVAHEEQQGGIVGAVEKGAVKIIFVNQALQLSC